MSDREHRRWTKVADEAAARTQTGAVRLDGTKTLYRDNDAYVSSVPHGRCPLADEVYAVYLSALDDHWRDPYAVGDHYHAWAAADRGASRREVALLLRERFPESAEAIFGRDPFTNQREAV